MSANEFATNKNLGDSENGSPVLRSALWHFTLTSHDRLMRYFDQMSGGSRLRKSCGVQAYEKLLPPLVANIRVAVKDWRESGYRGASATSLALLTWWFTTDHLVDEADGTQSQLRYYFAQREAVETVIWLYDVRGVRDKFDLLRFDASGAISANMFDEDWPRFVLKMATGAGKTKVLSLLIAWCFFHKLYEPELGTSTQLPAHRSKHYRAGSLASRLRRVAHLLQ